VLLLEDFPFSLGPAYLFSPHDAALAPGLLYRSGAADFHGDISGAPAPGGVFLHTRVNVDGLNNFRFYPARRALVVRFLSLDGGRVRFEVNPQRPAFCRLIATTGAPAEAPFAVRGARARREGGETVLDLQLDVTLPPGSFLAATLSFFQNGGFHPWGRLDPERGLDQLPILVSERPGGFERNLSLRVAGFPDSERIRCDFWASSSGGPPLHLGRVEAPVEPRT
ncbi:MAG: hypothetical protein HY238_18300, partial [Acidobacteria bacterium]|nr:hypothetical protein [Acidobacteriota bacterium]